MKSVVTLALVGMLVFTGCAEMQAGPTREEVIGQTFDSVIARRGPPHNAFQMAGGRWVYEYFDNRVIPGRTRMTHSNPGPQSYQTQGTIKPNALGGYSYEAETRPQPGINYITGIEREPDTTVSCTTRYVVDAAGIIVDAGKSGEC